VATIYVEAPVNELATRTDEFRQLREALTESGYETRFAPRAGSRDIASAALHIAIHVLDEVGDNAIEIIVGIALAKLFARGGERPGEGPAPVIIYGPDGEVLRRLTSTGPVRRKDAN
jgi:hypothetical protein